MTGRKKNTKEDSEVTLGTKPLTRRDTIFLSAKVSHLLSILYIIYETKTKQQKMSLQICGIHTTYLVLKH